MFILSCFNWQYLSVLVFNSLSFFLFSHFIQPYLNQKGWKIQGYELFSKKHLWNKMVATIWQNFFFKATFPLKFIGGIKSFASNKIVVTKWSLDRADQAKNMSVLKQLAGIKETTEAKKRLQPSQIMLSEKKFKK